MIDMIKFPSHRSALRVLFCLTGFFLVFPGFARGQILYVDQEVEVHNLPALVAHSHDPVEILLTALDTVLHDHDVCCGKDSALEDSLEGVDPQSLKDVASRLQGRHLLSDGRPIKVTAEYLTSADISSGHMITTIANQHAAIMKLYSHLYVVHGLAYFWQSDGNGGVYMQLHKLFLSDPRYSDSRREMTFTIGTDDLSKVEAVLFVESKPE